MEIVNALRTLWRHRTLVAVGALVAVITGVAVAYRIPSFQSRSFDVGVATGEILVDTPSSQVVAVAPAGVGTVAGAANLLATIMTQGTVQRTIAVDAGLSPQNLFTVAASGVGTPANVPDTAVRKPGTAVLTTKNLTDAAGDALPIIWIEARASDAATAVKVANASVSALRNYLASRGASERIPNTQRLVIDSLGPPQAHLENGGPSRIVAPGVGLGVFALVCALILFVTALARGWREASAEERDLSELDFDPERADTDEDAYGDTVPDPMTLFGDDFASHLNGYEDDGRKTNGNGNRLNEVIDLVREATADALDDPQEAEDREEAEGPEQTEDVQTALETVGAEQNGDGKNPFRFGVRKSA
jgi:hypothetical protein